MKYLLYETESLSNDGLVRSVRRCVAAMLHDS